MGKHNSSVRQRAEANSLSRYYGRGLWQCPASPFGAHHWIIDAIGRGECKHCGEKRQFAEPAGVGWWQVCSDGGFVLEEFLRELLPIV